MTQTQLREYPQVTYDDERLRRAQAAAEATSISSGTAVAAGILVLVAGVCASLDQLQSSGLALFAALVVSIASVAGRPTRGARWVGPAIVGAALVTVILAGFLER